MSEDKKSPSTREYRAKIDLTRTAFENPTIVTDRGLKASDRESYPGVRNEGYLEALPTFNGLNFIQHIDQKILEKGKISLLDIGTGPGVALLELRQLYPKDKLRIVGLDNENEVPGLYKGGFADKDVSNPIGKLRNANIDFVHGNFIDIYKSLKPNQFDIVLASYSFNWMPYPVWNLIKKTWRLLAQSGIAFVGPISFKTYDLEGNKVEILAPLKEAGLEFQQDNGGISFRKTQDLLPNLFQPTSGGNFVIGKKFI